MGLVEVRVDHEVVAEGEGILVIESLDGEGHQEDGTIELHKFKYMAAF